MTLRISAKNLGHLALPDACPRCFWIQTHCKLPYQIFPGIFSSIDSYTKKVIHLHLARTGRLPSWLAGFGDIGRPIPVPHHSKFVVEHRETGVVLNGMPDEMTLTNAGLWILDYKTAKFTGTQDALLPVYRVQLNGYALIAETIFQRPVVGLGLVYFEPVTDIDSAEGLVNADGFSMDFRAKLLPLERDRELVPSLLAEAKAIHDLPEPPAGREGCKDCELLDAIMRPLTHLEAHSQTPRSSCGCRCHA
jgi:hypothetical protein